jgi:tol-pal system protein YbgF
MRYFNSNDRTAIFAMAVLVCGLMLVGCVATQRDATEIKAKLDRIERSQAKTDELAARMDSLMTAGADADNKLRNDIRYSVDELGQQLTTLLENYNELVMKVDQISRQQSSRPVKLMPSPGASDTTSYQTPTTPTQGRQEPIGAQEGTMVPPPAVATISDEDCTIAFELAFTSLRQNEYDSSEVQFRRFMDKCPNHEKIPNAHFWLGENYYLTKKYTESIAQFETISKEFQDWPDMSQVYYKIARNMEEQGRKKDAKGVYQKIVDDYPGSFSASQASERLKEL